jgi:hypothetical protein
MNYNTRRGRDTAPYLIIIVVALGVAAWWLWTCPCAAPPEQAPAPAQAAAPPAAVQAPEVEAPVQLANEAQGTAGTEATTDPANAPAPPERPPPRADLPDAQATTGLPPDEAMEALRVTFRNYSQRFRGNPVGNNAEITAMLRGGNPGQVQFIDPEVTPVNDRGELVDQWGSPYFFHQLAGDHMEIRSAGADRVMWTADDMLTR